MMSYEEIARHFHRKGEEVTPDEIRQMVASIAAKFRLIDPTLPADDDELMQIILANAKIQSDHGSQS